MPAEHFLVIDTYFLPMRQMVTQDNAGFDVSAFGGQGGELLPYTALEIMKVGTDEMVVNRKAVYMEQQKNVPQLNGSAVDPMKYQQAFIAGFTEIYRIFIQHKSGRITTHYSAAELSNLIAAANKVCDYGNAPVVGFLKAPDWQGRVKVA